MKTILLIGLGRFGRHLAIKLNEMNHQVMAVDKDESRVNAVLPFVTNAQIGDSTSEEFLSSLGVRNFDVCMVAIGDDFQSSLECATVRMRWCIRTRKWQSGQRSDTAPTISQTMLRWEMTMPSLKLRCQGIG